MLQFHAQNRGFEQRFTHNTYNTQQNRVESEILKAQENSTRNFLGHPILPVEALASYVSYVSYVKEA